MVVPIEKKIASCKTTFGLKKKILILLLIQNIKMTDKNTPLKTDKCTQGGLCRFSFARYQTVYTVYPNNLNDYYIFVEFDSDLVWRMQLINSY